jgi:inosine/xanthosine triphosphatase
MIETLRRKNMKRIIVASTNPVKLEAVLNGFKRAFPDEEFNIQGISVNSGVSHQPTSDEMTLQGACTRALNAKEKVPDGSYWVGIEGGCDYLNGDMFAFAWIMVLTHHTQGRARTAFFRLPRAIQMLIESGMELGDADDQVFGKINSKQKSGAVGILTRDVITRTTYYEHAVVLALIPLINPDLY